MGDIANVPSELNTRIVFSYLDIITQRFTGPATLEELNKAIDIYNNCWKYIKDNFPERIDLDFLHVKRLSMTTIVLGVDTIKYRRLHLQKNAEVLTKILSDENKIRNNDNENVSMKNKNHNFIEKPSVSFNIENMVNSQIQHGNLNSNQTLMSNKTKINELKDILDLLQPLLRELTLSTEQKQEANSEIQTIKSQIESPKPKISIISESLSTVIQILEMFSTTYPAVPMLITKITQWLSGSG